MRQTLLIGDYRYREFRDTVDWLKNNSWLALAIDIDDALTRVTKQHLAPELIVIAQSHPGQFERAAVERLFRRVPLARLVAVLGSWCESETRTGTPWPGVLRLYWHQFPARVDRAFLQGAAAARRGWSLPRTCSDAERLLAETGEGSRVAQQRMLVIRAVDLATYQAVANALHTRGYATTWVPHGQRPAVHGHLAGIWDSVTLDANETRELTKFAEQLHPAPLIALVNFPRLSDCRRLWTSGVSAVLGKPWLISDLVDLIGRETEPVCKPFRDAFAA